MTDGDDGAVMGEARTDRHAALAGTLVGLGDGLLHEVGVGVLHGHQSNVGDGWLWRYNC